MRPDRDDTAANAGGATSVRKAMPNSSGTPATALPCVPTATGEPVLYVDDARYQLLSALLQDARSRGERGESSAGDDVQRLLFHEARMLDDRRYDEWLALFAPECLYWVPSRFDPGDPRVETSIYLDDRRRLGDRVAALRTGFFHAQNPPSRTRRMLSNIEQWTAADGSLRARANMVVWEYRKGTTRAHAGWQAYEIARDARGLWMLANKIVCLLDCDAPQGNYAFIL
jgi:3-phenylpropionate/cinnamic acid dioxygenase small subunit